jgi:hypothetical protein
MTAVEKAPYDGTKSIDKYWGGEYKITIPKEEPKQDWYCPKCQSYVSSESVTFEETHQLCNTSVIIQEPKQEKERGITITHVDKQETQQIIDEDFAGGLTMGQIIPQEERTYTEEDVKNAFLDGWQLRDGDLPFPKAKKKWFNEFKKK